MEKIRIPGLELRHTARRSGRLLTFLRGEMELSSSLVKRLKWENALFVGGVPARVDYPVVAGDEILVVLREPLPAFPPEEGPLEILYEDEALLIVDKPPGLWVHPTPGRLTGTLANRAAFYLRKTVCGVHVATRLDRDTFGVVLLAKYAHIHALLGKALAAGRVQKTYLAAVFGAPPEETGTVTLPIGRRNGKSLLREVREDGKPAVTDYRVLEHGGGASLLELRPKTGRTHQLRIHCAALNCPILGDRDYGNEVSQCVSQALQIKSQQLCAASLTLPHPLNGGSLTVRSRQKPFFPCRTCE